MCQSPEKVARVALKDVPIPAWFGQILEYYLDWVRPALKPKKGVKALWINTKGGPLGNIYLLLIITEYKSYTTCITKFVATIFPGKHITPIAFRRSLITLVFESGLHEPGKTTEDFMVKFSWLNNTSYKVAFFKI